MKNHRCWKECLAHLPSRLADVPANTSVLLALSGGADSAALLHILAQATKEHGFSLFLAHVHHGIRGEEADRDRDFCASLAKKYDCEIFFLDTDVPALAREHNRSIEEEGRILRYEFFARLMKENNIPLLATAHHADDNLETLLFRLARGSGTRGLCGIPPVRPFAHGHLTRPLLTLPKAELLDFCRAEGLEFVTDSTNDLPCCTRNRIRGELVPALHAIAPHATQAASRAQAALREDNELLDTLAAELLSKARTSTGLRISLLQAAPRPLVKRALLSFCLEHGAPEPETVHLEAVLALVEHARPHAPVSLPGDLWLVAECDELRILPAPPRTKATAALCTPLPLTVGTFRFPESNEGEDAIVISVSALDENTKIYNLSTADHTNFKIPSAIIKKGLFFRTRVAGERLFMGGMHRSLRRLYAARGVPARLRDSIPLLCDAEGVLWAPLVGVRDGMTAADASLSVNVRFPQSILPSTDSRHPTHTPSQRRHDAANSCPSDIIEPQHPQTEERNEKTQHCP